MIDGWTRGDRLTVWNLGVAVAVGIVGIWAALFSPQFQAWWKRRSEENIPITLGNLTGAEKFYAPSTPGMIKADRETLKDILAGLPSQRMQWLHFQNFGDGFWLSQITNIRISLRAALGPSMNF